MKASQLIKTARQKRGWTQAELARAAGVAQSAIARWESGRVSPRAETLDRILRAAGFLVRIELIEDGQVDRDQIIERLGWTPIDRLRYLEDMIAFEDRARQATMA